MAAQQHIDTCMTAPSHNIICAQIDRTINPKYISRTIFKYIGLIQHSPQYKHMVPSPNISLSFQTPPLVIDMDTHIHK